MAEKGEHGNPDLPEENFLSEPLKPHLFDPEKYLEDKVLWKDKLVSEEALKTSLERLTKPLQKIDYQDNGYAYIQGENLSFEFKYSPPNEDEKEGINEYINSRFSREEISKGYLDLGSWRKLDYLVFDEVAHKGNVLSYLGINSRVLFCPTKEDSHGFIKFIDYRGGGSGCDIYIVGDMASPRSLITLFHEMGHFFDFEELKKQKVESFIREGWHSKNAEKIRKERSASAFAFKWMRPFLKDKQLKEDTVNFLKRYALADYNCSAEEEFSNELVRKKHAAQVAGDWEVEQEESRRQSLFGDFWLWRDTEEYQQWKAKEGNKNLEDYEIFPAWEKWVEETNYDFKKDLEAKEL